MILLIDNYDSFSYNLYQYVGEIDPDVKVIRNDELTVEEIRDEFDALDAISAVLPAGTLSGAPKIRACQLIGELENNKRGIYGGAIGYIDFTGNMDTCIAIRIAYKKNGKVFVRSGAGIVADSAPEKEYEECINKAKAVMNALELAGEADL